MQLGARAAHRGAPVHRRLAFVALRFPGSHLLLEGLAVWEVPFQALPGQHAELDFRLVEPAGVLRRVVELQSPEGASRLGGGKVS